MQEKLEKTLYIITQNKSIPQLHWCLLALKLGAKTAPIVNCASLFFPMQRGRGKNIDYVWENPEKNMRNSQVSGMYSYNLLEKKNLQSPENLITRFFL